MFLFRQLFPLPPLTSGWFPPRLAEAPGASFLSWDVEEALLFHSSLLSAQMNGPSTFKLLTPGASKEENGAV